MMTQIRGASNAKAQRELGWEPAWRSWREGFSRGSTTSRCVPRPSAGNDAHDREQGASPGGAYRATAPAAVLDRLPDARQRQRGRGRRPGGVPALPPGPARRRHEIESPKAYLSAVATRLAIDQLRSARARRERTSGEWLPEPLLTDGARAGPGRAAPSRPTRCRWRSCSCSSGSRRSSGRCSCSTTSSTTATTRSPGSSARARTNCRQLAVRARRHVTEQQAPLRGLAAAARASWPRRFFARRRGRRPGRPGRAARRRRRGLRRRRRQGPRWPRPIPGATTSPAVAGLGRQGARPGRHGAAGRDQRPARRAVPRPGRPADQRHRARHRRRRGADGAVGHQPGQARHLGPLANVRAMLQGRAERRG